MVKTAKTVALPRRKPLRLKGFDYAAAGWYFVTVCSHDRACLFGEIVADSVRLSDIGRVVEGCWLELSKYFAHIATDAFVVMPNHIHGIVSSASKEPGAMNRAPTLGQVVRSFKARSSRGCTENRRSGSNLWQRGYYEHVIRNDADLARIREYIANNPLRWADDAENPERRIRNAYVDETFDR
jgi:putative transposase